MDKAKWKIKKTKRVNCRFFKTKAKGKLRKLQCMILYKQRFTSNKILNSHIKTDKFYAKKATF